MFSFAKFGNELYTGKRSYDIVGRWRLWFSAAGVMMLLSAVLLVVPGLTTGIEFRGGSEFRVEAVADPDPAIALDVVAATVDVAEEPRVSVVGERSVRVQTVHLSDAATASLRTRFAQAYGVPETSITSSFVGPSWGQDVTRQAVVALVVFLVLVALVIAGYFRNWEMAVAALVALLHDLVVTAGIYAAVGFEVTPATVIGFLTILGYSLYDTVVVFDKVRENTAHVLASTRLTYGEAANLAVNQTMVRSINTSVVALLPVGSILFIGAFLLGAGTLKDISLALFVGLLAGTYSSIFLATPLLVRLRERSPAQRAQAENVARRRATEANRDSAALVTSAGAVAAAGATSSEPAGGPGPSRPPGPTGPRNQPHRPHRGRPSGKRR